MVKRVVLVFEGDCDEMPDGICDQVFRAALDGAIHAEMGSDQHAITCMMSVEELGEALPQRSAPSVH